MSEKVFLLLKVQIDSYFMGDLVIFMGEWEIQ